jgi:hypothetical protein
MAYYKVYSSLNMNDHVIRSLNQVMHLIIHVAQHKDKCMHDKFFLNNVTTINYTKMDRLHRNKIMHSSISQIAFCMPE